MEEKKKAIIRTAYPTKNKMKTMPLPSRNYILHKIYCLYVVFISATMKLFVQKLIKNQGEKNINYMLTDDLT